MVVKKRINGAINDTKINILRLENPTHILTLTILTLTKDE